MISIIANFHICFFSSVRAGDVVDACNSSVLLDTTWYNSAPRGEVPGDQYSKW